MPSPISANIGTAVTPAVQSSQTNSHGSGSASAQQISQATRTATDPDSRSIQAKDKDRAVQIPKRTEAGFEKEQTARRGGVAPESPEDADNQAPSLDITV